MRKFESAIFFVCLVVQVLANNSLPLISSRKTKKNGIVKRDNNAFGRRLQVLPTLLKKFLDGRRKFDTFDNVIGDVLFGMAPSDSPSMTPSDSPTSFPSETPSSTPSSAPSAAPFSWNDVLGNDSSNFKTCPSNAIPLNYTTNTELTILYSYKIELQPNAHLFKTLEKMEKLLEAKLVGEICDTPLDVVGISSSPSDIPGSTCGTKTAPGGASKCYMIAGRFELLVGVNLIADANSVYCKFLEATRAYILSGDIMGQIPEVASINSTIGSSLFPKYCSYQNELSASQNSDVDALSRSTTTVKRVVPIVIGLFAILIATATIFMYTKYRTTSTDIGIDEKPSASDSDLEFQNSDETDEFEVDPTATVDVEKHYQVTHSKKQRTDTPNKNMTLGDAQGRVTIISPSLTEQEIVFTPTSSVATSVLFRSP